MKTWTDFIENFEEILRSASDKHLWEFHQAFKQIQVNPPGTKGQILVALWTSVCEELGYREQAQNNAGLEETKGETS